MRDRSILLFPNTPDRSVPERTMLADRVHALNTRYRHQLRRMIANVCPQAVIHEAGTIKEVLSLASRVNPQLVLVDLVLGDENGIHCTRQLKARIPDARIILISAYPDREFHRRGLEAGAIAFLDKKDLDANTLRQVVDDAIV